MLKVQETNTNKIKLWGLPPEKGDAILPGEMTHDLILYVLVFWNNYLFHIKFKNVLIFLTHLQNNTIMEIR